MIESPRRELDQAIDRVAAKLVAAPGGGDFLQQVIARLPEREATSWFLTMRVQLIAAAAIVLVAFLYARPSREGAPVEVPEFAAVAPVFSPIPDPGSLIPDPRSPIPVVTSTATRRPGLGHRPVAVDRPDHERSLAPVDAIEAIELTEIAAPALAIDAPATLQPLVLTDLALDPEGDR